MFAGRESEYTFRGGLDEDASQGVRSLDETPATGCLENLIHGVQPCLGRLTGSLDGGTAFLRGLAARGRGRGRLDFEQDDGANRFLRRKFVQPRPETSTDLAGG
jgi:hypothetical protein